MSPQRKDATPAPQASRQGNTRATDDSKASPRLPHEHDESADSQPAAHASHDKVARQAHKDITEGKVDTDRGPVMDQVYNEKISNRPDKGR